MELKNNRQEEFLKLYKQGLTLQQIGDQYNITRERVRQIIDCEEYANARIDKLKSINEIVCLNCGTSVFVKREGKFCSIKCFQEKKRKERIENIKLLTQKHCNKCDTTKAISEFYFDKKRATYGTYCRKCQREFSRDSNKRASRKYHEKMISTPEGREKLRQLARSQYEKRKERMKNDPEYRQQVLELQRNAYIQYTQKMRSTEEGRTILKTRYKMKYAKKKLRIKNK